MLTSIAGSEQEIENQIDQTITNVDAKMNSGAEKEIPLSRWDISPIEGRLFRPSLAGKVPAFLSSEAKKQGGRVMRFWNLGLKESISAD